jgi:hypothetical protein
MSEFLSRLHHPMARAACEAHGHCFASFVILDRDHRSFRRVSPPVAFELHPIVKFKRQRRKKNHVLRRAVFNHRSLTQANAGGTERGHLHRNAHCGSVWKKLRQSLRTIELACAKRAFFQPRHVASRISVLAGFRPARRAHWPARDTKSPCGTCTPPAKGACHRLEVKLQQRRDLRLVSGCDSAQAGQSCLRRETRASHGLPVRQAESPSPNHPLMGLGSGRRALHSDVIAFQLAVQRGATDAQHLAGERLVALRLFKDLQDGHSLHLGKSCR